MSDITFSSSSHPQSIQVQGNTEKGIKFVDEMIVPISVVLDSGKVIVRRKSVPAIETLAKMKDLSVEFED